MIPNLLKKRPAGVRTVAGALLTALLAVTIGPGTAAAQWTIRGRVLDSETGQPLHGARVAIAKRSPELITDSLGQFEAKGLPAGGDAQVTIQMLGYARGDFRVRIPLSGDVDRVFSLDYTGHRLPAVAVQARAEQLMPRYSSFEQRRQRALGAFFRWDQLQKEGYGSVGDALRTVRGVKIQCNQQTFECFAVMARNPTCKPVWIIDGQEVHSFHESTPILDVYGIEIYRGAGEVPGEYAGSNAACGVILLWTKSRPYRVSP